MVPDKFNMVDMEGIDIITSQGEVVEGLYQKLVESIAQCRYQCLYNWKFDGILIPPTYVEMDIVDDVVWINEGVSVDEKDVVRIYSLEPPAPEPRLLALTVSANGDYFPPADYDGFNSVNVSVPEPVFNVLGYLEEISPKYSGGYEYAGYLYDTKFATDLELVLLSDSSQGADTATLLDSISNYSGIILQGVYQRQRTSGYNTSILYLKPVIGATYWAGMKDRNQSYTCNVTLLSDTTVSLSGNKQVIIYGIL